MFAANIFMRDFVFSQGSRFLERSAQRSLSNAEKLVQEAVDVFSVLPHFRVPVCDAVLQDRFRVMMLRHPVLHDVGLVYNGNYMYCSSMKESTRFVPVSDQVTANASHLSLVVVKDNLTDKNGILVQWHISERVSIGAFLLSDSFALDAIQANFADFYRMKLVLNNGDIIAETSPESRLKDQSPFYNFEFDPAWTKDLIEQTMPSDRYPIQVAVGVPFDAVWNSYVGAMNVINGLSILAGALILFFCVRLGLKKPDPYHSIEAGIRRKEFIPFYQPIIDIQTGRLSGCEVLVRWRKPDGTILSPGHFIDVAEASGLARPMTTLLMEQVASDLSIAYQDNPGLKVAINLFNGHFQDLAVVQEIQKIFGNSGVHYKQLVFEITERLPLENLDRARAVITRLQDLGIRVALDDAGTGHGGFAYLQKLGMDIIKIDKLFVDAITEETDSVPIVDSLSQMAKGLDMVVVAEGVETEQQLSYLRRSGIDEAQGYLFAPALPASGYVQLVNAIGGGALKKGRSSKNDSRKQNSADQGKKSA
ncbi:EAL domain-containing protein [uncultured Cohaesibacter sp.]|uniref:EAL domain-containing protein n=1 Tax=uncultured Cohaesibacter sp. TaxID=1002546 RepID=UPI00292F8031|nr:EAL domain-containing protein [uncultured Cohaesibacter sp.]